MVCCTDDMPQCSGKTQMDQDIAITVRSHSLLT